MIIRAATFEEFNWIAERTGLEITSGMRAIAALDGDRIVAMVAGTGWTPNAVSLHIAVDEPIALRELLPAAARGVFDSGRTLALGMVKADNHRSLRIAKHIGFREIGRVKDGWDKGVDLVALEMRREWCRWLYEPARKVAA